MLLWDSQDPLPTKSLVQLPSRDPLLAASPFHEKASLLQKDSVGGSFILIKTQDLFDTLFLCATQLSHCKGNQVGDWEDAEGANCPAFLEELTDFVRFLTTYLYQ